MLGKQAFLGYNYTNRVYRSALNCLRAKGVPDRGEVVIDNDAVKVARGVYLSALDVFNIIQRSRPTGPGAYEPTKAAEWLSANQSVRSSTKTFLVNLIFEAFMNAGSQGEEGTLDDTLANLSLSQCLTPTEVTRLLWHGHNLSGNDTISWLTTDLMVKLAGANLSPSLVATYYARHGGDLVLVLDHSAPVE